MAVVVDRRPQAKNKSASNRERFIKRYKHKIEESLSTSKGFTGKSITDVKEVDGVSIPTRDIKEPFIGHGDGGVWDIIAPGNTEHSKGDKMRRPKKGGKGNGGSNSEDVMEDEFQFTLTKEEFAKYFFDGLELPNLERKKGEDIEALKMKRAGYTLTGTPSNIDILRSLRNAKGRRIAQRAALQEDIERHTDIYENETDEDIRDSALAMIQYLEGERAVPFLDPIDLRYRNTAPTPKPAIRAVMFCIMDVSGSMTEDKKDIAKRFFILLYLFLTQTYKKIDLVFIRHHTTADECSEHDFFYGRESGGTVVSSALTLMAEILKERYSSEEWNVYAAQASDGDNWNSDNSVCGEVMEQEILPKVQHYSYLEIIERDTQHLWDVLEDIKATNGDKLAMTNVTSIQDIYPAFCSIFVKRG